LPGKTATERILVEDLGAENVVEVKKLGEFTVMDGEDLLTAALNWMKKKRRLHAKSRWSHTQTPASLSRGETLTLLVYKDDYYTEYRFQSGPELHVKFHLFTAHVCVPISGDAV